MEGRNFEQKTTVGRNLKKDNRKEEILNRRELKGRNFKQKTTKRKKF